MRERAVILCISGRGGVSAPSGITNLRNRLRETLVPLGVVEDNIFRRSWNHNEDDNPFGAPWVSDLKREIDRRVDDPTYLALIGHSYGGWAACKLSNATGRIPDYVGLIDPVFGATNSDPDQPIGGFIKSWYQQRGIMRGDCFGVGKIPCVTASNGISCGYNPVPGAHENERVEFVRNWHGETKMAQCVFGEVPVEESHVSLDDNEWIWRAIHDQIVDDIQALPTGWSPLLEPRVSIAARSNDDIWSTGVNGETTHVVNGTRHTADAQLKQIAVGADGSTWGIDSSGSIYRKESLSEAAAFRPMPGNLTYITVGSHDNVWGVNVLDEIFRWNGQTWDQVPGALRQVSVGYDGEVWGVGPDDDVFRWNGETGIRIPGKLKQVEVASAGNVWGVNRANEVYWWTGERFQLVPDGRLASLSLGYDGSVWGTNKNGLVFRRET